MGDPTRVPEPGAFNAAEAAAWLGISKAQVYRLLSRGELRARRCGRRILIPRQACSDYLNGGEASS